MPEKPTVQEELLAACKTSVECATELFAARDPDAQLTGNVQRRRHAWKGLRASRHIAQRAIERAEREVDGE